MVVHASARAWEQIGMSVPGSRSNPPMVLVRTSMVPYQKPNLLILRAVELMSARLELTLVTDVRTKLGLVTTPHGNILKCTSAGER